MRNNKDLINQTFGRWTVIKRAENYRWLCKCQCGISRKVSQYNLLNGRSKSCGCLQKEKVSQRATKHGLAKVPLYKIWTAMKQRCGNPKDRGFKDYGGRGITVCERWFKFKNFYVDMGEPPKSLTLERIDNNKGYSPENCKWASRYEQNRNSRRNRNIIYNNEEKCLVDWAHILGIDYQTLSYRLDHYSVEKAFTFTRGDQKHSKIIKYQGEVMSLVEWSEKLGINYNVLWWRLNRYPPQIAFNM